MKKFFLILTAFVLSACEYTAEEYQPQPQPQPFPDQEIIYYGKLKAPVVHVAGVTAYFDFDDLGYKVKDIDINLESGALNASLVNPREERKCSVSLILKKKELDEIAKLFENTHLCVNRTIYNSISESCFAPSGYFQITTNEPFQAIVPEYATTAYGNYFSCDKDHFKILKTHFENLISNEVKNCP